MKSSMPVRILKAHVLRFRIKFHIVNSMNISRETQKIALFFAFKLNSVIDG